MNYNWDWGILFREPYIDWLLSGLGWTISLSLFAWIIAFSLGSALGIMRTSTSSILRFIGTTYVEIFRNVPLLVQLFLWFFVFPELVPDDLGRWIKRDMPMPALSTAIFAIGLYTASRVCEQVRSGIDSVGVGQRNAGRAIGLSEPQIYRYILLPNAYRIIIPPLTVVELTAMTRQIEEYTFQGFEAFTAATVIYSAVTFIVMFIMRLVERKIRVPGMISVT